MRPSRKERNQAVKPINPFLKTTAKTLLPKRVLVAIASRRWWNSNRQFLVEHGLLDVCQRFVSRYGTTVLHGPFKGLKYPEECALTRYSTLNLLGSYEMELHPWLSELKPNQYERLVDIGASEGYYAVGMALRTGTPVDAYETESRSRCFCREMARLNGVSHLVSVRSWCNRKALRRLAGRRCLVISDCEGYEVMLFTRDVVQALRKSDIIIELHEGNNRSSLFPTDAARSVLESRFAGTHELKIVTFGSRDCSMFPEVGFLGADAMKAISEEGRGANQEWLIATPRVGPAHSNTL
jgi:hypothetical protein